MAMQKLGQPPSMVTFCGHLHWMAFEYLCCEHSSLKQATLARHVSAAVRLPYLHRRNVWGDCIIQPEDCALRKVQLLLGPGLLVGPMEVNVAAVFQPGAPKPVILPQGK